MHQVWGGNFSSLSLAQLVSLVLRVPAHGREGDVPHDAFFFVIVILIPSILHFSLSKVAYAFYSSRDHEQH